MNTKATHTDTHVPVGDFYAMRSQRDALVIAAKWAIDQIAEPIHTGEGGVLSAYAVEYAALRAAIQKAGA
jgi:hypothetical protein